MPQDPPFTGGPSLTLKERCGSVVRVRRLAMEAVDGDLFVVTYQEGDDQGLGPKVLKTKGPVDRQQASWIYGQQMSRMLIPPEQRPAAMSHPVLG